jgi:hypothetical protein
MNRGPLYFVLAIVLAMAALAIACGLGISN